MTPDQATELMKHVESMAKSLDIIGVIYLITTLVRTLKWCLSPNKDGS